MLSPISKGARESLYRDVESVVNRYGNLSLYERAFTLRLVVHKLEESSVSVVDEVVDGI